MKTNPQALQIRAFDYEVKETDDAGHFSGYGSVFGVVDSYNEVVAPGAFTKSLEETRAKKRAFPVLWQHKEAEPIGHWDMATLSEDDIGLAGDGNLWLDEAPYARLAHRGMKERAITGLSIGYYTKKSNYNPETKIRTLTELELVEISIVTSPANDEARIDAVKAKLAHGSLPNVRELEYLLRQHGFSKAHAAVIANNGLTPLLDRGEPEGDQSSDIPKAFTGFRFYK